MRTAPVAIALLFVTAVGVAPSEACICDPPLFWTRPVTAPEVFAGTITSVRETTNSWDVRMSIERSWKGSQAVGTVVSMRVDDSRRKLGRFAVGQRWMIFAAKPIKPVKPVKQVGPVQPAPALVTSDCYGNWRVTKKAPLPFLPPPPSLPDGHQTGGRFGSGLPGSSW